MIAELQIAHCKLRIGAALIAALTGAPHVTAGEIIDRVLAVVGGDLIMLSDVTAARDLGLVRPDAASDPARTILSRLIDRALILREVERYAPPEPGDAAVDRELQAVRARLTAEAFAAVLLRSGIDVARLRATLREDLRICAYLDERFTVPAPSEDELGRHYREHPEPFTKDGVLRPFDEARADVAQAVSGERRARLIEDWVAGLRRRVEIVDLYATAPQ